ncbi:MAG TPA: cytidylate kinase-like family protein, partial [Candidatus Saccharimonadales bacterium]|nr:cytidylate kinase-like family protein [Candidatus Saccharimonadales bacterium]
MKQLLLIDQEYGAGAITIGEKIAKRLNWKFFDQALTDEVARLAKIPVGVCQRRLERNDPILQRLVNVIWRGSFDRNLPSPDLAILDSNRLASLVQKVIEQTAEKKPCVIIGRGAPYFLRNRTDIFCVFLFASRELKFRRVLKRVGNEAEAIHLVDNIDEDRRKFVKHHFGHDWPNRHLFHAMFNTSIGDENVMEAILRL